MWSDEIADALVWLHFSIWLVWKLDNTDREKKKADSRKEASSHFGKFPKGDTLGAFTQLCPYPPSMVPMMYSIR